MKKHNKKKIILITILSVTAILVCTGIGGFIWYNNSPFPTALKMMSAFQNKDIDAMMECIEPQTAQKIEWLINLTDISPEDLLNQLTDSTTDTEASSNISIKPTGYVRNGDSASITLTRVNENGDESAFDVNFIRISGSWYLTLY